MRGGHKVWVGVAAGVVVGVVATVVVFVASQDEGPDPAVAAVAFARAWSAEDRARMEALVVDPASLERFDPMAVASEIAATDVTVVIDPELVEEDGGEARAPFVITMTLGDRGDIEWRGTLPLVEVDELGWRVPWREQVLHPAIPDGGTIDRSIEWAERAPILGAGDQPLVGPIGTTKVGIEPRRFDREQSIPILVEQLGIEAASIEAALDAPGVEPDHFVPIAELRQEELAEVRDAIGPIPGVLFSPATGRGGPTEGFARNTLGRIGQVTAERLEELGEPYEAGRRVGLDGLEARYEEQLAGKPTTEIVIVDAEGDVVEVLATLSGVEPVPLRTTLDQRIQLAAEEALAGVGPPAALVAIDAASGEVRAAVSQPLGAFNRAISGTYPPGSTFKVITGYGLLTNGVEPGTPVECPAQVNVGGRRFRNFEGEAAGTIPFSQAFAHSCNTAFIGASQELPDGALTAAAGAFGFEVDYSVGLATIGGSFPTPEGPVEHAAAAIGQARVIASPMHMASVAAAVLDGTWRSPRLVHDEELGEQVSRPLDPGARDHLASLMRLVVGEGTGTAAQVPGLDLLGKTGTAEYGTGSPPPTHAWFISAGPEGLGVAVVLEGGGVGGRDAAPVAARFWRALQ